MAWCALLIMTAASVTTASAHDANDSSSNSLSPTAIGVLIVGIVVVFALGGILWWFLRRRKATTNPRSQPPAVPTTPTRPDFFMTAFSPPSSSYGKNLDSYNGAGVNIDARANVNGNPRMKAPTGAPYSIYGRVPGREPLLYNREATTTLRINDSARSYLYEPTTPPDRNTPVPKIYSSKNSVDLTYVDTNRSNNDLVDSTPLALRELNELDDSSRTNDTDPYGFIVHTNDSTQVFSVDDIESERSLRLYLDDSVRSSQAYGDFSVSSTAYHQDVETNALNTRELRDIKVEL